MSHNIVGLDIGAHSVKVVQIRSGMRSHTIGAYHEAWLDQYPVPEPDEEAGEAPALDPRVNEALADLKHRGALEGDVVVVGYSLGRCVQAHLSLPFGDRRKIEAVLPVQVEDHFPIDIEDLTTDFQVSAANDAMHHRVQVIGTPNETIRSYITGLNATGVDPRIVEVGPAGLLAAAELLNPGASVGTVALVDIGHSTTDVCLVENGEIVLMRSLRVAGSTFTERIASGMGATAENAEQAKHHYGAVDHTRPPGESPQSDEDRVQALCYGVASDLARELGRTFHGYATGGGNPITAMYVCGGGANLKGVPELLAAGLGIEVRPLWHEESEQAFRGGGYRSVPALGLAARGMGQRPASQFNLRSGGLAFRGDFEFLRARALSFGIAALCCIISLVGVLITNKKVTEARVAEYADALCIATEQVFEECIRNPNTVLSRLGGGSDIGSLLPEVSAYEIFRDISVALVDVREVYETPIQLDKLVVDVQRDVVQVEGRTNTAASVDLIVEELDALECLVSLESGETRRARGSEDFEFNLRGENGCQ